jgi:hypothetical protein
MEFSMRSYICYTALGVALLAGTSLAHAQTVETVITPQPAPAVIAPPGPVVQTAPAVETETIRTVRSRSIPKHAREVRGPIADNVTTTTVRERVVSAPVAPPAVTYPAPLYDVVGAPALAAPAVAPAPMAGAAFVPAPAYRYVYEPDRILVIDTNTGIAVQAIPR